MVSKKNDWMNLTFTPSTTPSPSPNVSVAKFFVISAACLATLLMLLLIMKQICWGLRPDKSSELPTPPRYIFGKYVLPINGCTYLFKKVGSKFYDHFDSNWKQVNLLPMPKKWVCSRELGPVFSVFVWARWRTIIHGEKRTRKVLAEGELVPSWAFFEPKTLLGKSCLCFLNRKERILMINLIREPLSQGNILRFASEFASLAESRIEQLLAGEFESSKTTDSTRSFISRIISLLTHYGKTFEPFKRPSADSVGIGNRSIKSYTLDLIDGPILGLHLWMKKDTTKALSGTERDSVEGDRRCSVRMGDPMPGEIETSVSLDRHSMQINEEPENVVVSPDRNLVLLWVKRFQMGILGFKFSLGGSWMQLWRLNEYGRALNARQHLVDKMILGHVSSECSKKNDIMRHHRSSTFFQDPLTTPVPIVTIAKSLDREKFFSCYQDHSNAVSITEDLSMSLSSARHSEVQSCRKGVDTKRQQQSMTSASSIKKTMELDNYDEAKHPLELLSEDLESGGKKNIGEKKKRKKTLLDDLISVGDEEGEGLSNVALAEVSMLLWFVMDVGSAWTSMALHLLGQDSDFFTIIQEEVVLLQDTFRDDPDELYSEISLSQMHFLDALIHEAIRLSSPFCGGMWQVSKTVSLRENDKVQIPKRSHVLLSHGNEQRFDLYGALGNNPFDLGNTYPNSKLFGFLPLNGMEVPLMVLQTKIFLISILTRCELSNLGEKCPLDSNHVVENLPESRSKNRQSDTIKKENQKAEQSVIPCRNREHTGGVGVSPIQQQLAIAPGFESTPKGKECKNLRETAHECRDWFSEIPFPEAKNEIWIRKRRDADNGRNEQAFQS